jgi:hypothetical protein
LTICLLTGALPAAATGATVAVTPETHRNDSMLRIEAAPGEANSMTLRLAVRGGNSEDSEWRVTDTGAPLSAGAGCRAVSENEAVCTAYWAAASLGDGDDRFVADEVLYADGGPGDDTLTGGPSGDGLAGGDGRDTVDGGGGGDHIHADESVLSADVLIGGPGADRVDYFNHPAGVTVNLADESAPAGASGEGDRVSGFEHGVGSQKHPNVLIGDEGPNFLNSPGPGSRVLGGGGNDSVFAGPDSTVDAGPGDDSVGGGGRLGCGSGTDRVRTGAAGLVARDCERLELLSTEFDDWFVRPNPTIRGSRATFRVPCLRDREAPGDCRGRLALRDSDGRTLARRRWVTRQGRTRAVGVTLDGRTLERMRRAGGLRVVVSIAIFNGPFRIGDGQYSILLTAP